MIRLIKNVSGEISPEIKSETKLIKKISGDVQREDYVIVDGFIGMMQDFSRIEFSKSLLVPQTFGLKQINNIIKLNIDL